MGEISSNVMYGMNSPAKEYDGVNKYIRITDIDEFTHEFSPNPLTSPDGYLDEKFLLKKGDIVFARTGASTGKSYIYQENDGKIYFAGFLIKFHIDKANSKFVFYNSLREYYKHWVEIMSVRSGQPGINANEYKKLKIKLPHVAEQEKIANFLDLISQKIKCLNKKYLMYYDFKKGLIQQIFTQKLQFNFSNWDNMELSFILDLIRNGYSGSQVSKITDYPVTRIETISKGFINTNKLGYVNNIDESYKLIKGDLLLSNINSLKHIGKIAYFDSSQKIYHGMNLLILRFNKNTNSKFMYYYLTYKQHYFKKMACQAVNQASIKMSDIKKMKISIPKLEEQEKIANFLSAVDKKIVLIQTQIEKMEEFKKGLLQQMFTLVRSLFF